MPVVISPSRQQQKLTLPWATIIIVFINLAVSFTLYWIPDRQSIDIQYANIFVMTMTGDYWRLFTNLFLHSDVIHLSGNMIVLLWAGHKCEQLYGKWRMLALYFLSGIGASLFSALYHLYVANPSVTSLPGLNLFGVPAVAITMSVGASGAIMGILVANLMMLLIRDNLPQQQYKPVPSTFLIIFLTLLYGLKKNIDNAAHIGGLFLGLVIAASFLIMDSKASGKKKRPGLAETIVLAMIIGNIYYSQEKEKSLIYHEQRNELIDYFQQSKLHEQRQSEQHQQAEIEKIKQAQLDDNEGRRIAAARSLHNTLAPAVDTETAMGTLLDIPAPTSVVESPDGASFYVGLMGENSIRMLDATTFTQTGEIGPPACKGENCKDNAVATLAISADGKTLYATSLVKNSLSIINLSTGSIEDNITVGKMPNRMVLSPVSRRAYILNQLDNTLSVVDLNERKIIKSISLPGKYDIKQIDFSFRPIALSHNGEILAAYDTIENTLLTMDTRTFTLQHINYDTEYLGNVSALAFSQKDDALWLASDQGIAEVAVSSGKSLQSLVWCGDLERPGSVIDSLFATEQGVLLLTAQRAEGVSMMLFDLKTRSNIGQYPVEDDNGFPRLITRKGQLLQGNYAHLQIAERKKSLPTDPDARWLCERDALSGK